MLGIMNNFYDESISERVLKAAEEDQGRLPRAGSTISLLFSSILVVCVIGQGFCIYPCIHAKGLSHETCLDNGIIANLMQAET